MQQKVREFNQMRNAHVAPMPLSARLLDLGSEIGELAKEYLQGSQYGTVPFQMNNELPMELGDCIYCLLSLAVELDLDANECLELALAKYRQRWQTKNSMGS